MRYRLPLVDTLSIRVTSVANGSGRFSPFNALAPASLPVRPKLASGHDPKFTRAEPTLAW